MDIHKKLILLTVCIVIIPLGILITISTFYLQDQFTGEQIRYLRSTLTIAQSEMQQRQEDIKRASLCVAQDTDTQKAIFNQDTKALMQKMGLLRDNFNKVDYAVIVDSDNKLLASQRFSVQYAQKGILGRLNEETLTTHKPISSTEVVPLAELFLPDSSDYNLYATKLKDGIAGEGELFGQTLCEVTIVPIMDNNNPDRCLGTLLLAGIANSKYYFPEYLSSKATDGFLVLTVDGVRVAAKTTLGEEKDWLVGTRRLNMTNPESLESYIGKTELNGITYLFIDKLLYNHAGKPIGFLSFGLDERRFAELVSDNRKMGVFVAILCLLIFIPLGQVFAAQIKHNHDSLERIVQERTQHLETVVAQLKKLGEAKAQLMANLTHELRTPVCVIINACDVLKGGYCGKLNDKQQRYISNASECGNHLLELINNLLDISKMAAGKTVLEYQKFGIRQLVEATVQSMKNYNSDKQPAMEVIFEPDDFAIEADPQRLKQIFYNLLSNAIKFTPEDGKITVAVYKRDDHMEVIIKDTGIGIALADQKRIFNEFEQADSSYTKKYAGTGLGLPIVKKLIELHRGQIFLTSKVNEGTEIIFTLPLSQVPVK